MFYFQYVSTSTKMVHITTWALLNSVEPLPPALIQTVPYLSPIGYVLDVKRQIWSLQYLFYFNYVCLK